MPRQVVIDASVVLGLLLHQSPMAEKILRENELAAPALLVSETLNGLRTQVRFADLELEKAAALLEDFLRLPVELVPDRQLAGDTLAIADHLDLTAYDASYVALAERRGVPLVTADMRLAARYERSELVP